MSSLSACQPGWGPVGAAEPRWLVFAHAGLSAQVECCSGCRAQRHGSVGVATNPSRAAG
jgi:hypothetical protein